MAVSKKTDSSVALKSKAGSRAQITQSIGKQ